MGDVCLHRGGVGVTAATNDAKGQGRGEIYGKLCICSWNCEIFVLRTLDATDFRWAVVSCNRYWLGTLAGHGAAQRDSADIYPR